MCNLLEVSTGGYYKWLKRPVSERALKHKLLLKQIKRIFNDTGKTYGWRRIHRALLAQGTVCNHKTVAALMKQNGITPARKRKFKSTTDSKHNLPISQNVLCRDFKAKRPNVAWVSDITYIDTKQGWLYLAVFIDLYSRQVVGWSARADMTVELVLQAYEEAKTTTGGAPLLVHSDRGSQYASKAFREELKKTNCIQSMSRKGNCWDNAVSESFFGMLKSEMVYRIPTFETRDEAKRNLFEYIEMFYNRNRLHSALAYLTPAEFALKGKKVA